MKKIELLAPAGSFEVLKSAIEAGCDAVYLAGKSYGARAYASNFNKDELKEAIDYCHSYGVKVYVTVNTIIFESEIEDVIKYIDFLYLNQVDAVIVQDLGLASIIHTRYKDLSIHASTQINATTLEDVKVLKSLGFSRVILAREVSIDTIKEIRTNCDIELEVFIHGALCMSYSGECYFSSINGDRSANRGRCAQPCRKEYTLNGKKGYFLSPKDLCTIDDVVKLRKYCDSLKIEGRMKSASYVSDVVKSYRTKLDNIDSYTLPLIEKMKINFNRDFTKGFVFNTTNEDFTNTNSSNHQGIIVGEVQSCSDGNCLIKLSKEVLENDSLRIVSKNYCDSIIINGMYVKYNNNYKLVKKAMNNDIIKVRVHKLLNPHDVVYLTKRNYEVTNTRKVNIDCRIYNDVSLKLFYLEFTDGTNVVRNSISYEIANNDLTERFIAQIKKTKNTIYEITDLKNELKKDELVYLEISKLNELRRNLLDELTLKRIKPYIRSKDLISKEKCHLEINDIPNTQGLSVAISDKQQEDAVDSIYQNSITKYTRYEVDSSIYYLPRVNNFKNNSQTCVSSQLGSKALISSIYFNVTNSYTVRVLESLGYQKIGLSIELSKDDIIDLVEAYKSRYNRNPNLEVMIYGHYQLMYMKHCFLNKFKGYKKLSCMECKKDIKLDDTYKVFGDSMCHIAILSKDPICLFSKVNELKQIGIYNFLIDFTKETKEEVYEVLNGFKTLDFKSLSTYYGHYLKEVL